MRQSDPKRPPNQVEPGGESRNPASCHSNKPFSRCAGVQIEPLFNELLGPLADLLPANAAISFDHTMAFWKRQKSRHFDEQDHKHHRNDQDGERYEMEMLSCYLLEDATRKGLPMILRIHGSATRISLQRKRMRSTSRIAARSIEVAQRPVSAPACGEFIASTGRLLHGEQPRRCGGRSPGNGDARVRSRRLKREAANL